MNDPRPAPAPSTPEDTRPCPACREPVHRNARKCHHCGETIREQKVAWWRHLSAQLGAAIGITTAVLSLFYALREGFYWVVERQEQRATIQSYRAAAARFEQIDNLDYAERALRAALALRPDDTVLQRQRFLLGAHMHLRELEDWPASGTDETPDEITALVLEGFRLLEFTHDNRERARVLTTLGRLLTQDRTWTDGAHIERIFAEAREAAPDDAEAVFRHGCRLVTEDKEDARGEEALKLAVQLDPENALYWRMLGEHHLTRKAYREAFAAFRTAAGLHPRQKEIQRIRAANAAKEAMGMTLRSAAQSEDITGESFLGMTMAERRIPIEEALAHGSSNRELHYLAARYFRAAGDLSRAKSEIASAFSDSELNYVSSSDAPKLELQAEILEETADDPEALERIRSLIAKYEEREAFDQMLEIGSDGDRPRRIGLRVHAGQSDEGVLVARAYEMYPFAKAGVQAGDRVTTVAHWPMKDLRDIWLRLRDIEAGTSIPIQVEREGSVVDLTLVVE